MHPLLLKTDMHPNFCKTGSRLIAVCEPMSNNADTLISPREMIGEKMLGCDVFLMPHGQEKQLGKGVFEFIQELGDFPTKKANGAWFRMWLAAVRVTWWADPGSSTWTQEGIQALKRYNDKLVADPLVFIPETVAGILDKMQPPRD